MSVLWTIDEMAAAMGARRAGDLPEAVGGLSIDSRTVVPGEAFFAIKGDALDGHDFVATALRAGAGLAVVSNKKRAAVEDDAPLLIVRDVLVALRKLSGFDTLLRKLFGLFNERAFRLTYLAGAVRVSERQFPHIHEMVRDGAYILDLPEVPECYVLQTPLVNAMALGRDKPFIVINSGMVELFDAEELRAVVGHEIGHILSGHAVYRTMLLFLIQLAARIAWMPIGYIGLRAIIWGLEEWFRKSELSCDRAGLLAGQDLDASRRVLMKLAGGAQLSELNPDAFREQAQ